MALLGRSNPVGIIFSALLFGAMRAGAGLMQIKAGIPAELVDVLQATILLFLVDRARAHRVSSGCAASAGSSGATRRSRGRTASEAIT